MDHQTMQSPRSAGTDPDAEPLHVIWLGDSELAERFMSRRAPQVKVTGHDPASVLDALLAPAEPVDLLVVDTTLADVDVLGLLARCQSEHIDLPVVLLTSPGGTDIGVRASRHAVCDCVVKTPDFVHQMLPAFAQVRARHDLQSVFRASRQSEERFRTILELQPAVTCIIGPDGTLSAMNEAGLSLLDVTREQVVGSHVTTLIPPDEQAGVLDLIDRVCAGQPGELEHSIVRSDGSVRGVVTRAVPLQHTRSIVALTVIQERREANPVAAAIDFAAERDRLARALRDAVSDLDSLRAERQQLENRADAATDQAAAVAELRAERDRLSGALEHATARVGALTEELERRNEADAESRARSVAHAESLAKRDSELGVLRNELQAALARLAAIDGERAEAQAQYAAVEAERTALQARYAALEDERRAEQARWTDTADAAREQHQATLQALDSDREQLRRALEEERTRCAALEAREAEAARTAGSLAEVIGAEHAAAMAAVSGERDQVREALELARAERDTAEAEARSQRAAWDETSAQHAAALAQLESDRNNLRTALAEADGRRAALEAEHAQTQQLWTSATETTQRQHSSELSALTAERDQFRQALQQALTERESLAADVRRRDAADEDARGAEKLRAAALAQAESERNALRAALDQALEQRTALEAELLAERARIQHQLAEAQAGHQAVAALRAERDGLAEALQQARDHQRANDAAHAEQRTVVAALESEKTRLSEALAQAEARVRALEEHQQEAARFAANDAVLDTTRAALQAADARCQHLIDEITSAHAATGQAESQIAALKALLAAAEARAADRDRLERSLEDDRRALLQLRADVVRFLADADIRCRTLLEHRSAALADLHQTPTER